jgi:hypothetical protein
MHSFIRILCRIAVLKQHATQQQLDEEIPKFLWYGTQEQVVYDFLQYVDLKSNEINDNNYNYKCIMKCLDVIVSIFNVTIRADPYQHVVLSVISLMGLKSDGTF